jgi:hypothetical protein
LSCIVIWTHNQRWMNTYHFVLFISWKCLPEIPRGLICQFFTLWIHTWLLFFSWCEYRGSDDKSLNLVGFACSADGKSAFYSWLNDFILMLWISKWEWRSCVYNVGWARDGSLERCLIT